MTSSFLDTIQEKVEETKRTFEVMEINPASLCASHMNTVLAWMPMKNHKEMNNFLEGKNK